jgi:fatty-acyl-CoA synthase
MPREIEELLSSHDDIAQAFAIGLTDERWGEIGCAVVVRRAGATITEDDVIALCKANLARFKVPKQVIFLEQGELPTTPTGKVQKYRLVPMVQERRRGDR